MWIAVIFASMFSLFIAHSFYTEYMSKEIPQNANDAAKDAGNFHIFALAAELYMRDHSTDTSYMPSGTTVVHWSEPTGGPLKGLKEAKALPSGLANVTTIDPNWRIQIVGDSYVLCTSMTMGGMVKMANMPQSRLWNPSIPWKQGNVTLSGGVRAVTFDVDAMSAAVCS